MRPASSRHSSSRASQPASPFTAMLRKSACTQRPQACAQHSTVLKPTLSREGLHAARSPALLLQLAVTQDITTARPESASLLGARAPLGCSLGLLAEPAPADQCRPQARPKAAWPQASRSRPLREIATEEGMGWLTRLLCSSASSAWRLASEVSRSSGSPSPTASASCGWLPVGPVPCKQRWGRAQHSSGGDSAHDSAHEQCMSGWACAWVEKGWPMSHWPLPHAPNGSRLYSVGVGCCPPPGVWWAAASFVATGW